MCRNLKNVSYSNSSSSVGTMLLTKLNFGTSHNCYYQCLIEKYFAATLNLGYTYLVWNVFVSFRLCRGYAEVDFQQNTDTYNFFGYMLRLKSGVYGGRVYAIRLLIKFFGNLQ